MPPIVAGGLRFDNFVNLGFTFKPSLAMSAKAFETLDQDIRSFRVPLQRAIKQVVAPSIGQNFVSNGRPDGWAPYADDTLQMKMADPKNKYGTENLLRRSGLLWKTMQQLNIWTITQAQAAILTLPDKVWYGVLHQGGYAGQASGAIPARPFAMFQTEDMDKIQDVFSVWLQERIDARLAGLPASVVR